MLIGLTGRNAAGKGEVAKHLQAIGFQYYSLSDVIRDEIRDRRLEPTRENLIQTGNELRQKFGPSVLADRILERIDDDKNYVIDSIRNPAEVLAFLARVFDQFLDSFARLLATIPRFVGSWVRPIQNGLVQFYALSMVLGLGVFLTFVVFRITR